MLSFTIPLGFILITFFLSAHCDPMESCLPHQRNQTYNIADKEQCDKYHICEKSGSTLERLCDDGFVYSLEISACEYPHNVNCSKRPLLQPTTSTHPNCPRSNGFYAFPPAESCQQFYHCLEGTPYEKTCPEGVIFDPSKGTCIHPDMSKRPDCAAKEVLDFVCPNSLNRFMKLKFGDHDRYPHSLDCRKFLICLKSGKPRVGGCPNGRVFNPKTGFCDDVKNVEGCHDYYGNKDIDKLLQESESVGFDFDGDFENNNVQKSSKKSAAKNASISTSTLTPNDNEVEPDVKPVGKSDKKKTFTKSKRHTGEFNRHHNNQQYGQQNYRQGAYGPQQYGPQQYDRGYNGNNYNQRVFRATEKEDDADNEEKEEEDRRLSQIKREISNSNEQKLNDNSSGEESD